MAAAIAPLIRRDRNSDGSQRRPLLRINAVVIL
jgi:hypothetical protein